MTAPKQRDQTAQEAAEAYLQRGCQGDTSRDEREREATRLAYTAAYLAGRAAGLEEAAEICEKDSPLVFGHRIAQAIRAASEGK